MCPRCSTWTQASLNSCRADRAWLIDRLPIVEAFLLVVLAIRCYVEWTAWKLKNLSPEWALLTLHTELAEAQMQRLEHEAKLRDELTALMMKSQYGARTNQLTRELNDSSQGARAQQQRSMSSLIDKYLPKVQLARQARFWLEAFFPLLFGTFAVLAAIWYMSW